MLVHQHPAEIVEKVLQHFFGRLIVPAPSGQLFCGGEHAVSWIVPLYQLGKYPALELAYLLFVVLLLSPEHEANASRLMRKDGHRTLFASSCIPMGVS